MRTRWVSLVSAVVVAGSLLVAPAAGLAHAQSSRAGLKEHCIVKQLPHHAQLTVCYVT